MAGPDDRDVDLPGTPGGGDVPQTLLIAAGAAVLLLALAAWFFRPWLHALVYAVWVTPVIVPAAAVAAALVALLARLPVPVQPQAIVPVFIVVLVAGAGLAGLFAGADLGRATMADAERTTTLSEANPETPRIVTKSVAGRYASNTLNFPQYRIAGSDITTYNGTPHWSYALAPDGAWNHFTKRQHGTVMVDMTEQNADVKTFTGDLSKGVGTAFYNNYKWSLLKRGEYLVEYEDPFMVVHEGEQYVAVPYTTPRHHWLPVPYTTPEWGGVMLVDRDGSVADLSPAEAREHPVLADQKLYPFDLARERVAATKYRNGIVNTFTSHEDQVEIAPVPGEDNEQPFYVQTRRGPEYVVAVEPYGDAQGLKELWTVDGRTGGYERYVPNESLFGPRKATDYVRQAARTTDWNRFNPSEPIPVVVDGTLYWEVRVVPDDSSGIAYIAFVNARTSDVVEVEETPEVVAFLEGRQIDGGGGGGGGPPEGRQPDLVVQRVAENGTVLEEMEVYGNETVRVRQGNRSGE